MRSDELGLTHVVGDPPDDQSTAYRVLATCGVFEPGFRGGGPIRSVAQVVDTVPPGIDLLLVTRDRDLGSPVPYPGLSGEWVRRAGSIVYYLNTGSARQWLRLGKLVRARRNDLLYVNSLWSPFSIVPILAVAMGILRARAILIAPRGELSPGALGLKTRKKRLFLLLWKPLLARLPVRWQACSDLESTHILATFPGARVMVSGQGLGLPREPAPPRARPSGPLRLVFISRISPMKNLELALMALRDVSKPVEFDIYGPLEDARYWSRCGQVMEQMPADVRVRYLGELAPEQVLLTFADYDAFLFPTRGENFGHVVLESLAASCPVVCSAETPWSDLIAEGGGSIIHPLTANRIAAHLDRLAATSPEARWRARTAAGEAYRSWRQKNQSRNVLEETRRLR